MSQVKPGPCDEVCSTPLPAPAAKGAGPPPQPRHLHKNFWEQYRAWMRLPNAPYPPGGTPSGGAQELSISAEEWASRARLSPCYQCELEQQVNEASKLSLNWLFWTGVGAGVLGLGLLAVMRKR